MNLSKAVLLLACTLFPACVDADGAGVPDPSGPGGGKGDDPNDRPSPHAAAVQACQATYEAGLGDDPSVPRLDELARCVAAANQAAAPSIDALVDRDIDSGAAITAATAAADTFCTLMQALEPDPDDVATTELHRASCRVSRNLDVGFLMDMHVAFGDFTPTKPFQYPTQYFPDCHAAYTAAVDDDDSNQGLIQASVELATCTESEIRDATQEIVIEGLQANSGLSASAARVRFNADMNAVVASIHATCAVFAAAGGNEDGSLETWQLAGCVADGIGQLGIEAIQQLETDR